MFPNSNFKSVNCANMPVVVYSHNRNHLISLQPDTLFFGKMIKIDQTRAPENCRVQLQIYTDPWQRNAYSDYMYKRTMSLVFWHNHVYPVNYLLKPEFKQLTEKLFERVFYNKKIPLRIKLRIIKFINEGLRYPDV